MGVLTHRAKRDDGAAGEPQGGCPGDHAAFDPAPCATARTGRAPFEPPARRVPLAACPPVRSTRARPLAHARGTLPNLPRESCRPATRNGLTPPSRSWPGCAAYPKARSCSSPYTVDSMPFSPGLGDAQTGHRWPCMRIEFGETPRLAGFSQRWLRSRSGGRVSRRSDRAPAHRYRHPLVWRRGRSRRAYPRRSYSSF